MRETYDARLARKTLLSRAAECWHFEFAFTGAAPDAMQPGQFLSLLAEDAAGKTYTRAYSIASAPYVGAEGQPMFDLCVNRVEGGFFSNLLCDMMEGETIRCHGPHGLFTLRQPLTDSLWIAAGAGIAPFRGFAQWLFGDGAAGRSEGCEYVLIYEAPGADELYYHRDFEQWAAARTNFHYIPVLPQPDQSEAEGAARAEAIERYAGNVGGSASAPQAERLQYAYVCGLSEMVKPVRAQLLALGWPKQQILFERYD